MPDGEIVVVDASIFVALVINGQGSAASRDALAGRQMHAPAHLDVEVTSALARLHRGSVITKPAARRALAAFGKAPVVRHQVAELVPDAWSRSDQLRVADAFYVALAHTLGTQVLTLDARLARATTYAVLPPGLED